MNEVQLALHHKSVTQAFISAFAASSRLIAVCAFVNAATGSPETVRRELTSLVERYQPDELLVTGMIHDHAARLRSFTIAAENLSDIALASEAA